MPAREKTKTFNFDISCAKEKRRYFQNTQRSWLVNFKFLIHRKLLQRDRGLLINFMINWKNSQQFTNISCQFINHETRFDTPKSAVNFAIPSGDHSHYVWSFQLARDFLILFAAEALNQARHVNAFFFWSVNLPIFIKAHMCRVFALFRVHGWLFCRQILTSHLRCIYRRQTGLSKRVTVEHAVDSCGVDWKWES